MTKKEIVKTISEEIGLTQLKTKEIVQKTFDAIVETLVEEKRIELRNFGVFEVKKRAARKARNPRTGDKVFVPEKYVVTFKPGKEMEERVRELERQAAQAAAARSNQATPSSAPRGTPPARQAPMPEALGAPSGYGSDQNSSE
ncbi:MAG: HU family DNA-binding protein [Pirellulales bacterium]